MIRFLFFILLWLPSTLLLGQYGPNKVQVSFVVSSASNISGTSGIYLTGNHKGFGPWNPAKVALYPNVDGSWIGTYRLTIGDTIELKYTRGSWETAEVDQSGLPIVHRFVVRQDTFIRHRVQFWKDQFVPIVQGIAVVPPTPSTTANPIPPLPPPEPPYQFIRKHPHLYAPNVSQREVIVHLPKAYKTQENRHFPVLYVHDGQQKYYGSSYLTGQKWNIPKLVKKLIKEGQIEPIIVVIINNQNDHLFRHFSTSINQAYRQFLTDVVKPFIDKEYRTSSVASNTASLGAGMGGTTAFVLTMESPYAFGKAICLSPIFEGNDRYFTYAKTVSEQDIDLRSEFYIDHGDYPSSEKRLRSSLERIQKVLLEKGIYVPINEGNSTTQRLQDALIKMFGY